MLRSEYCQADRIGRHRLITLFFFICCFNTFEAAVSMAQTQPVTDPFDVVYSPDFAQISQSLNHNDYDQALTQLADLRKDALKTRNRALLEEVVSTLKKVNQLKREFSKLSSKYEALQKNNDPEACREIGNFYCAEKGNWRQGLTLLTKSDSSALQQTALADLKRPDTAANQAQLADAWWKLAADEKGETRKAYLLRGRYWYLLARPRLPPDQRVNREKILAQIPLEADKIVIWNQHNGGYGDRGTLSCAVTLLYQGKSVWRQVLQLPWSIDAPASSLVRPPRVRFDQIRVDINRFRGGGGGLGEVEVFYGPINLTQNCSAVAKEYFEENRQFHPLNLTDGDTSGNTGYWLLNNGQTGWAMIDLINFLQQP